MLSQLTPTEYEIFLILAASPIITNKQIAISREKAKASGVPTALSNISEHTVASHVQKILEKLDVSSRYLLQEYAIRQGIYCPNVNCTCVKKK